MAAGAILPPLFFERHRPESLLASGIGSPGTAFSGTPDNPSRRSPNMIDVNQPGHP
jgi:hypothetical protein